MKTLKFRRNLSELILKGLKNNTWRLFDDKDLSVGDRLSFLIWETGEEFSQAEIISVKKKTLGTLTEDDWVGHEKFETKEAMYKTYSNYYNRRVDEDSPVKVIKFK